MLHGRPFLNPLCRPFSKSAIIYLKLKGLNCSAIISRTGMIINVPSIYQEPQAANTSRLDFTEKVNILFLSAET